MPDKADLVDPDAPPTDEEAAKAQELRAALEDPTRANEDADLARTLAAAWSPRDLAPPEHWAIVDRALSQFDGARKRKRAIGVSFGASAILALAASVCLVFWATHRLSDGATGASAAAMAVRRSTQPLFPERFAPLGGETSRIDRISMARAGDLRDNEFAKWGVR
jgi:hypothetical protein